MNVCVYIYIYIFIIVTVHQAAGDELPAAACRPSGVAGVQPRFRLL